MDILRDVVGYQSRNTDSQINVISIFNFLRYPSRNTFFIQHNLLLWLRPNLRIFEPSAVRFAFHSSPPEKFDGHRYRAYEYDPGSACPLEPVLPLRPPSPCLPSP